MEAVERLLDWLTTAPVADYQWLAAWCVVIFLSLARCYQLGRERGRGMWVLLVPMIWVALIGSQAATPPPGPPLTPVSIAGGLWFIWLGWYLVWRLRSEADPADHNMTTSQHRVYPDETAQTAQDRVKPPKTA